MTAVRNRWLLSIPLLSLYAVGALAGRQAGERVLDAGFHHLGDNSTPEWPEATAEPEGQRLDVEFHSERANDTEWVLVVQHRHVSDPWSIRIDGVEIGRLQRADEKRDFYYPVPAGAISAGSHVLSFVPEKPQDDLTIGNIRLVETSFRELKDLRPVLLRVVDSGTGAALPARVTITDPAGELVDVFYAESSHTATRKGLVYVMDAEARLELPAGSYVFHATRGMEWGHATAAVEVSDRVATQVELAIRREVDTSGWIAADTHIHTLEHSGHGDASEAERLVTLAGEGVELAVATDHNHNIDYRPLQERMGLNRWFTPVVGNEVTTDNGHFNAFPLDASDQVPDYEQSDWVKLVAGIRARGARVVILNHPRWPEIETGPYGVFRMNRLSGERHAGPAFSFDAMELANSTTLLDDPDYLLTDWFALLNHGERITAVGSSDSHTVGDPVGQGRTYVRSSTDDAGSIDVDEACDAFLAGRTSVSMGYFIEAALYGEHGHGETVQLAGDHVRLDVRVAAPSWIHPDRLRVYVNGTMTVEQPLATVPGMAYDECWVFALPAPRHDAWIVCVALGPGVSDPCWRTLNPYTIASTNPIYLDRDGDGTYDSPRATARRMLQEHGSGPRLARELAGYDPAVRVQAMSLARDELLRAARARLEDLAGEDAAARRYLSSLPDEDRGDN